MDYPSKLGVNIFSGDKNTYKETVPPILGITEKEVSI
jgi:hypothetical protein